MKGWISLFLLGLALVAQPAHASNEDDFFVGNGAAMVAGAVTATVYDGSATFDNPAGLSRSRRYTFRFSRRRRG